MILHRLACLLVAVAVAICVFGSTAAAQDSQFVSDRYCGWGGYDGLVYGNLFLGRTNIPIPPYFALHPPVYYSYPVPRPYGWSPFAYPPSVMTPEFKPRGPLEVINPHVKPEIEAKPTSDKMAAAPLVVINPYVAQAGDSNEAPAAKVASAVKGPQVVYPTKVAARLAN